MRTSTKIHALIAIPYVRTELQLRFAWCMTGLSKEEYDLEERKGRKKKKRVLDDKYERPNDPRRSGSSVREAERRSLFHSVHVRTNYIGTSVEHLCQDGDKSR